VAGALALVADWIAGGLGDSLARSPVLVAMLFGLLLGTCLECPASMRAAVLDHGGEGSIVRDRFFELSDADQQAIYRFLSTL